MGKCDCVHQDHVAKHGTKAWLPHVPGCPASDPPLEKGIDAKLIELELACPCGKDPDDCMIHAEGGTEDIAAGIVRMR